MPGKRRAKKPSKPSTAVLVPTRFTIVFTSSAVKEADALAEPLKSAAANVIARLADAPLSGKVLHGALKGCYSVHVGHDWRVVYSVDKRKRTVAVIRLRNRRVVYR